MIEDVLIGRGCRRCIGRIRAIVIQERHGDQMTGEERLVGGLTRRGNLIGRIGVEVATK